MSLVSLELDEMDKKNFTELQGSIAQAQQELSGLTQKLRARNAEAKHAQLTLAELQEVPDECKAYEQVGKMFLLRPLPELVTSLDDKSQGYLKEVAAMTEKKKHMEEAYAKVQEDFQEFVKAHVVEGDEKKDDAKKD